MRGEEPRGGTRGGKDQFNWNEVREDKDRMLYLGNSLKAPVGRWQKGRDVFWFERSKSKDELNIKKPDLSEIEQVKMAEEEAMAEALGIKPSTSNKPLMAQEEINKVLNRSNKKIQEEEDDNIRDIGFDDKMKPSKTEFVSFDSEFISRKERKREEPYDLKSRYREKERKKHKKDRDEKDRKKKHKNDKRERR